MLAAIIGILLCGLVGSGIAILGSANVEKTINDITRRSIPAMNDAQRLALEAERLLSLTPQLVAAESVEGQESVSREIVQVTGDFKARLAEVRKGDAGGVLEVIDEESASLLSNIAKIDEVIRRRLELLSHRTSLEQDGYALEKEMLKILSPVRADLKREQEDSYAGLAGSSSEAETRDRGRKLVRTIKKLEPVNDIVEMVAEVRLQMTTAVSATTGTQLTDALKRAAFGLSQLPTWAMELPMSAADALEPEIEKMAQVVTGPEGVIATRSEELDVLGQAQKLIVDNTRISRNLSRALDQLVRRQEQGVVEVSNDTYRLLSSSRTIQYVVCLAGIVISILVAWLYVSRVVVNRLLSLKNAMGEIATGNLDAAIDISGNDEISQMGRELVVFRDTALEVQSTRAEADAERTRLTEERRTAMDNLADSFEAGIKQVVQSVSHAAEAMHQSSSRMSEMTTDALARAGTAGDAVVQASNNVKNAAAAAQQLKASISEIAHRASEAAEIAGRACKDAEHADTTMTTLDEAVARIDSVLELITTVADQTNLLALNATIEAARAGDVGKGFAVVAAEVKKLAGETASATEQIEMQISAVRNAASEAGRTIGSISGTVVAIEEIAAAIAVAVEEQDAATGEIARHVLEAADSATVAANDMNSVRSASEVSGQSAEEVLSVSGQVKSEADRLLTHVDHFLTEVRA